MLLNPRHDSGFSTFQCQNHRTINCIIYRTDLIILNHRLLRDEEEEEEEEEDEEENIHT